MNEVYLILWLCWFAFFFAVELPAAYVLKRGGTLSELVWTFMEIGVPTGQHSRYYKWKRIAFLALWAWLTAHFFFQFA